MITEVRRTTDTVKDISEASIKLNSVRNVTLDYKFLALICHFIDCIYKLFLLLPYTTLTCFFIHRVL